MNPLNIVRQFAVAAQTSTKEIQKEAGKKDKAEIQKEDVVKGDDKAKAKAETKTPEGTTLSKEQIIANSLQIRNRFLNKNFNDGSNLNRLLTNGLQLTNNILSPSQASQLGRASSSQFNQGAKSFVAGEVYVLLNDKEFRKKFNNFGGDIFNAAKRMLKIIEEKGDFKAEYVNSNGGNEGDRELYNVLRDGEKVNQLISLAQNLTDAYMDKTKEFVGNKGKQAQEKAQYFLSLAQKIIKMEKSSRVASLNQRTQEVRGLGQSFDYFA